MRTRVVALLVAVVSGCGGAATSSVAKSSTRPEPVGEPTRKASPPPVDPRLMLLTEHDERLRGILAQGFFAQRIDGACQVWKVEEPDVSRDVQGRMVRKYEDGPRKTVEWRSLDVNMTSVTVGPRRTEVTGDPDGIVGTVAGCGRLRMRAVDSGADFVRVGEGSNAETWFRSVEACEAASSKIALGPRC